jgi:hypothetical protein
MKTCVSCRTEVDDNASICPQCRSDVSYNYFIKVPESSVLKERSPLFEKILLCIGVGLVILVGFFTIIIAGFWVGAGTILIGGILMGGFLNWILKFKHNDSINFSCPGCSHPDKYILECGELISGKQQRLICSSCGQLSQIEIV